MTALPTIHLNGSGAENLREEYTAALNALQYAREALVHATLNMRDFYPQGDEAYIQAREERTEAFRKIQEIEDQDQIKLQYAKDHGYDVLVVWEREFKSNKDEIIKKCIQFLTT